MPQEKKDNVVTMKNFNSEEELKAMKMSVVGMSKQLAITIETTNKIIENYNLVINHQNEIAGLAENLYLDNRLMKNILNQLKGFFEKSFPSYASDPHFVRIREMSEMLIDSSENALEKKKNFFEQIIKANNEPQTKA